MGDDIIEEVRTRMARYPHAELGWDASSITYYPPSPDGFVVRLTVYNPGPHERYTVCYAGSPQQQANRYGSVMTFGFGLSTGCRVREFSRNGQAYRWLTDVSDLSGWKPSWEHFNFTAAFWKFWIRSKIQILQNRLIDLDAPGGGAACAAA